MSSSVPVSNEDVKRVLKLYTHEKIKGLQHIFAERRLKSKEEEDVQHVDEMGFG